MESSIMNEEFKDLTVEELTRGYVIEDGVYRCIFCGETFEDGLIYTSRGRSVTAGKAMAEHIADRHDIHSTVHNHLHFLQCKLRNDLDNDGRRRYP